MIKAALLCLLIVLTVSQQTVLCQVCTRVKQC